MRTAGGVDPLIERGRGARSWRWLALALAAPALALAQQTPSGTPSSGPPAAPVPATGAPAASVPGAGLPGVVLPSASLLGAEAAGLTLAPANYTLYGGSAGLGETDDVNLSSPHPKAQTLTVATLMFDVVRSGTWLDLNTLGNFSDIDYLEHAYSNQVLGSFDGLANLKLWSNHLTWLVRDDYGDAEINPLEQTTPNNIQRLNDFSTGPDLKLEPTRTIFVGLQALYSRINYQTSPFDGQTGSGAFTIGHRFSALASISLVGQVQQLRFDNRLVNTNYQVRESYADYNLIGARTTVDLQAGVAQADDVGTWKTSPRLRLALTRSVTPFSTVTLNGGREYFNAADGLSDLTSGAAGGIPIGPATQTSANALRTYGNGGWQFQRLRTTIGLTGGWEENQYDRQRLFNYSRANVGLHLGRQLTPRLSANISGSENHYDYLNQGFSSDFGTAGGALVYHLSESVVLYGRYDHTFRSTSGEAKGFGYDENRVFLMIGYYPHSSGTVPGATGMPGMPGMPGGGGVAPGGGGSGPMP
ncbi:MAG: hypothetical protein ACREUL_09910 [Steroidobacteraceae bacterium]